MPRFHGAAPGAPDPLNLGDTARATEAGDLAAGVAQGAAGYSLHYADGTLRIRDESDGTARITLEGPDAQAFLAGAVQAAAFILNTNGPRLTGGAGDPSAGAGAAGAVGSIYMRTDGSLWLKTGATATDWAQFAPAP